jgi:hypothetical protein
MSGIPCHGCPGGEATIQEKRGEKLAWCSKDCQKAYYTAKVGLVLNNAPIGYGLFGFIRGPPGDPDKEPSQLRDLFYETVKQGLNSIAVAGGTPMMASQIADNLELMFLPSAAELRQRGVALPANDNDPGFTDEQRRVVFGRLFSPSKSRGSDLETRLGVTNVRAFKQQVLAIAIRRGYHNTARYIRAKLRGNVIAVLQEPKFNVWAMLRTVPLDRRIPTLEWLTDVLNATPLSESSSKLRLALVTSTVGTDDVALYKRSISFQRREERTQWEKIVQRNHEVTIPRLLEIAIRAQAPNMVAHLTQKAQIASYYRNDALLVALLMHPHNALAQKIVTLVFTRVPLSYIPNQQSVLHAAMARDRYDVFGAVIDQAKTVHADVRNLIVTAARNGDHEYIRMYARAEAGGLHAMNVLSNLLANNPDMTEDTWEDVRLLLERRPVDDDTPFLQLAFTSRSPGVIANMVVKGPSFANLMASVANNDDQLLVALLYSHGKEFGSMEENTQLSLLDQAARFGSLRSLKVLRTYLTVNDLQVRNAAAVYGDSNFIFEVSITTGLMTQQALEGLVFYAVDRSREGDHPSEYQRAKAVLHGFIDQFPSLLTAKWDYWKPLLKEFGLQQEAQALEDRQQRRDTGKSARNVERRVVLQ